MRDFRNDTMSNDVPTNSNKYIELESHWYWFFDLYKKFKKEKSVSNYKNKFNDFFTKIKEDIMEIIKNNQKKAIENIQVIINLSNSDISDYKGKMDLFKERIEELEEFI